MFVGGHTLVVVYLLKKISCKSYNESYNTYIMYRSTRMVTRIPGVVRLDVASIAHGMYTLLGCSPFLRSKMLKDLYIFCWEVLILLPRSGIDIEFSLITDSFQ